MGSGKTTLGRALQAATGLRLIDLDELIEQRQGMSISRIFAQHSEAGFREIERRILAEVSLLSDIIIACGGGTPCFFKNMELMNASGLTVFLDASIERLHQRLRIAQDKRPLIATMTDQELMDYIGNALDRRRPYYTLAAATFPADRLDDAAQIAESVDLFRRRLLSMPICAEQK